jgi:MFS family permease
MSSSQAGLIQSGWHAGYIVSLFAAGILADRIGARRTFLGMSIAGCIASLAFAAFSNGHLTGLLLYTLAGAFAGGSYTPVLALISQRFPAAARGRAMGWYIAAGSLSYGAGLAMSGPLVAWGGWRFSLYVAALGAALGTVMAFRLMRGIADEPHVSEEPAPVLERMGEVLRNRPAMLVVLAYTFHGWELLGLWAWLPAFLAVAVAHGGGVDASVVGIGAMLAGLTHLTSMAGSLLGGAWSDRWGRTAVMLTMAVASLACSLAFGWLVAAPLWLVVAVAVVFNLTAVGDSVVYSTAITEVVPARILGSAYAIRSVLGFGAGALSAWVFGVALDATRAAGQPETIVWGLAWTTLALGALPGPLCTWLLRRDPASLAMAGGRR